MKKILWFIISLIMMFSIVGCADNNNNSLPIIPDSSNLETNTDGVSKEDSSDSSSTETEKKDESLENGDDSLENDDSSSNENENKPSNETNGWTGFY